MGINMELVPCLLLKQHPLLLKGFPLDVGSLLRGLASICFCIYYGSPIAAANVCVASQSLLLHKVYF
jgi:hypothetical protein